jgi:hypothetical protein
VNSQTVKRSIQQIEAPCLKSLDAIHVANAIQWEPDIFVSGDFPFTFMFFFLLPKNGKNFLPLSFTFYSCLFFPLAFAYPCLK